MDGMTLDLRLATPDWRQNVDGTVSVEEQLLWDLPGQLGLSLPIWERVGRDAFDNPRIEATEVRAFAAELQRIREQRIEATVRTQKVTAKDPVVRRRLALEMVERDDAIVRRVDALLALCERAIAAGVGIYGLSD